MKPSTSWSTASPPWDCCNRSWCDRPATLRTGGRERRLRASRKAGLHPHPRPVRATDDDVMLRDALLENLHRVQLNALEEAGLRPNLMSDFSCTQEELA